MARTRAKLGPDPVDVIVGANVLQLRKQRGISQSVLGEALGMTFQQIQKYEKGTNRIASSNLVRIAKLLGVSVTTLFNGAEEGIAPEMEEKGRAMLTISPKAFQVGQLWDKCDEPIQRATLALLKEINRDKPELIDETPDHAQQPRKVA